MRVFLATFGCRANHADSEVLHSAFVAAGHEVVSTPELAEGAVFNSCAVTGDAEADLRQAVRRAARRNPALRTVITGCAAALDDTRAGQPLRALPTVETLLADSDPRVVGNALGVQLRAATALPQRGARALLRVQDGCDEHCTFCATTLARGASRSRPMDAVVRDAAALAERHAEIVITGVHIGSYGLDIGASLGALVERLVREVPAARFRLTSVEATEVDDRLRELFAGAPRQLAPSLHAPLQSGSDRVLRRMGRHWYTARSYSAAVERMLRDCPIFGLGADVIAGFPGETDEDHTATRSLLAALPFTYLHVFPFSARPGTSADRLGDLVAPAVAQARAAELRALGEQKAAEHRARRTGTTADVVIVRGAPRREGMTEDYVTVGVSGDVGRGERHDAWLVAEGDALFAHPTHR